MIRYAPRLMGVMAAGLVVALAAAVGHATPPAGHFVVSGTAPNDIVTDTHTGLIWQRTIPSGTYTQASAVSYCAGLGGGYRLPSFLELLSILDRTRVNPSIDPTAFPSTPSVAFWSVSPYVGSATTGWAVELRAGLTFGTDWANTLRVRCVR